MKFLVLFYLILVLQAHATDLRSNPEPGSEPNNLSSTAEGSNFMVSTADRRASLAAKDILQKGGNAMDAVIAAQMILALVEPNMS